MPLWDVAQVVTAAIDAPDAETAMRRLREALESAGFRPVELAGPVDTAPAIAEDGVQPFGLPR